MAGGDAEPPATWEESGGFLAKRAIRPLGTDPEEKDARRQGDPLPKFVTAFSTVAKT